MAENESWSQERGGFGTPGELWSVVETCRQPGRSVWDLLTECVAVVAEGGAAPSLLTMPNAAQFVHSESTKREPFHGSSGFRAY
jgi:hypothetical protein